jgi:diamine N-acetyltransferase
MDHSTIRLIPITAADVSELQTLGKTTFLETFASSNTEDNMKHYLDTSFTQERLVAEMNNPGSEFYFAKLGDQAVGYLKINFAGAQTEVQYENSLELERIYVLEAFQGQKVGQLLLNEAIKIARTNKMDYLWLGVWEHNLKAIIFYEKNGFAQFATHAFQLGDDVQTDILMKIVLND